MSLGRKLIPALISTVGLATSVAAQAGTRVVITVDAETAPNLPLPVQARAICADGRPCGLIGIAEMLHARRMTSTVFLDAYEYKEWGEQTLRDIAAELDALGQEVALHTHPQWAYDSTRNAMYEYTLEEQTKIIADGAALLSKWTGRPVVSHRAGDYTANADTLKALAHNGIRFDSSLFFQHPHSHLDKLPLPKNAPSELLGITEIPVTIYRREERVRLLPRFVPPFATVRKLDPDWFYDEQEALATIDAQIEAKIPVVVLFLHSFSFMASTGNSTRPIRNANSERIFTAMLDHIEATRLPIVAMRDLGEPGTFVQQTTDVIPAVPTTAPAYRYAAHWVHLGLDTDPLLTVAIGAGVVSLLGGLVLWPTVRSIRRSRHRPIIAPEE